jgi:hypothetical protein
MVTTNTEPRHFENWMPTNEYQNYKQQFMETNQGNILRGLNRLEEFNDLTLEEKNLGANLVTRFLFGVKMAYKRMGMKYENYDVTYDNGEGAESDCISYCHDENK